MNRVDVLVECVGDVEAMLHEANIPNLTVRLLAHERNPNALIGGAAAVMTSIVTRVDQVFLDAAGPSLKVVANYGVGYDNLDLAACRSRNVIACNGPPPMVEPTADVAWLLLLGAARRIREGLDLATSGEWRGYHPTLLLGHALVGGTLLVVGAGRIGAAVMRRGEAWNMRLLYTARSEKRELNGEFVSLHDGLARADAVVVCVALNNETRHLIGAAEFARMQDHAVFVNVSRGPVVDEAALAHALQNREIFAAGLDVYEAEPAIHPDLLAHPRAILLPHVGSATIEDRTDLSRLAVANIAAVLRGENPPFEIQD
jgi:glyoxylate reductase